MIDRGRAAHQSSGGNVVRYSALRSDNSAFSYLAVSDYPDLASQNHSLADFRRTGETDL